MTSHRRAGGPADGSATSVRAYGADALLVDLPDLDAVRRLDDLLRADPPAGAVDVVPAARTLLVRFAGPSLLVPGTRHVADLLRTSDEPGAASSGAAQAAAPSAGASPGAGTAGVPVAEPPVVELPVRYDGPDLVEVADLTGLDVDEVVRRHATGTYTVAFGGFMPGFAYLTGLDPALHVPRRSSPRTRVPGGAVAVAGEFAAVYPAATPGGWRLLGTCDVPLFDVDRDPPALLPPGTRVRFVPAPSAASAGSPVVRATSLSPGNDGHDGHDGHGAGDDARTPTPSGTVEVLATGPLVLVQDAGRPGLAAVGVGRSGAADAGALRRANRLVGNAAGAAALEVLLGGVELGFPDGGVVALAGAEVPGSLRVPGRTGGVAVAAHAATRVPPGGVLVTGTSGTPGADVPEGRGLRLYVAVRGGIAVPPVLGSRSTDQLAGLGPAPVRPGDVLPVGSDVEGSAQPCPDPPRTWPASGTPTVLRVLPGPRPGWFAADALDHLARAVYTVTPASNRVALRLDGPPVLRADRGELPSEPVVPGAVQVPPDGQPVVFGADHPVTGGYPVLAVLTPAARDVAAQLSPGDRVVLDAAP